MYVCMHICALLDLADAKVRYTNTFIFVLLMHACMHVFTGASLIWQYAKVTYTNTFFFVLCMYVCMHACIYRGIA
jgi:hypothetical protein